MATFFYQIPLELRNQIYAELLVDEFKPIEPKSHSYRKTSNNGLHLAILQTCKQTQAERTQVFWEQNDFRYCFMDWDDRSKKHPYDNMLGKIRHLELRFFERPRKGFEMGQSDVGLYNNKVVGMMCSIAKSGCFLKTLRIELGFWKGLEPTWLVSQKFGVYNRDIRNTIEYENTLCQSFSDMTVQAKIEFVVCSYLAVNCEAVDHLVRMIGHVKQWALTGEQKYSKVQSKEERPQERWPKDQRKTSYGNFYRNLASHIWTWTLEPATRYTIKSIPNEPDPDKVH